MHKRKWAAPTTSIISTQPWVIRRPGSLNGNIILSVVLSADSLGDRFPPRRSKSGASETFLPGGLHVANARSDGSPAECSNRSRALRLRESFSWIKFSLST